MNIEGILVPIVTPFTADNQVDTALLAELVQAFIAKGVRGIVACGTTGEYYALSEAERETVLTTIVKAAAGRCTLIARFRFRTPTANCRYGYVVPLSILVQTSSMQPKQDCLVPSGRGGCAGSVWA